MAWQNPTSAACNKWTHAKHATPEFTQITAEDIFFELHGIWNQLWIDFWISSEWNKDFKKLGSFSFATCEPI